MAWGDAYSCFWVYEGFFRGHLDCITFLGRVLLYNNNIILELQKFVCNDSVSCEQVTCGNESKQFRVFPSGTQNLWSSVQTELS